MADDSMGDVENEVTVALNPDKDAYDLNSACDTINNNNSENSENNNHNKHNSNIGMNKAKTIQKNNNHNNDHNNDSDNNNVNKHHNEPDHSSAHPPCNLPSATTGDEAAANNININSSNDNSIHNYNRINNDRKNNDDAHPASKSPRQSPRKTTSAKATAKSKSARKSPRTQPTARAGEVDQADVDNAHDTMVPGGDLSRTRSSGQASDHATAIPRGLGKHFEMPCMQWYTRWHVLVLMILLALMTGIIFVFSLYSADVQHRLGWNDDEVNLLGAQKDVGFAVGGVLGGFFCDKFGIKLTALVGATLNFGGFLVVSMAIRGYWIPVSEKLPIYFAVSVAMFGISWMQTAVVVSLLNFPLHKGYLAGFLKGFMGLGAAVYTEVYQAYFRNDSPGFLMAMALIPVSYVVAVLPGIQLLKPRTAGCSGQDAFLENLACRATFRTVGAGFFALMGVCIMLAITEDRRTEPIGTLQWHFAIMMAVILSVFGLPAVFESNRAMQYMIRERLQQVSDEDEIEDEHEDENEDDDEDKNGDKDADEDDHAAPPRVHRSYGAVSAGCGAFAYSQLLDRESVDDPTAGGAAPRTLVKRFPKLGEDHTLGQTMRRLEFWLMWIPSVIGYGAGYSVSNNIGHIVASLGNNQRSSVSVYVSVYSVFMAFGRVSAAFMSDLAWTAFGINGVLMLCLGYVALTLSLVGMASTENVDDLSYSTAAVGFAFGVVTTVYIPLVVEFFGAANFASNYNAIHLSGAFGSLIFGDLLFSYVYDTTEERQRITGATEIWDNLPDSDLEENLADTNCYGPACIHQTFMWIGFLALCSVPWWLLVWWRTRGLLRSNHERQAKLLEGKYEIDDSL